jgi:hypothetical protein
MRPVSRFERVVQELDGKLNGSWTILTPDEITVTWSFQDTVAGIKAEPAKRHGRTDEEIDSHVLKGKAAEIGVAKLLGVGTFDVKWDKKDRASYAKDVVYNGIRIEVKSTHFRTHFSLPSESFNTMMGHVKEELIDAVLFAHVEKIEETGNLLVTPSLIVDPYPECMPLNEIFDMKSKERGSDIGFTYVYPALGAYKRGLCHPLVEL